MTMIVPEMTRKMTTAARIFTATFQNAAQATATAMSKRIIAGSSPARDSTAMATGPELASGYGPCSMAGTTGPFRDSVLVMSTVDVQPSAVLLQLLVCPICRSVRWCLPSAV